MVPSENIMGMEFLFSWEVSSVVIAILVSVALAVLALNDFRIAKGCFLIAALWAAAGMFVWAAHSTWDASRQIGIGGVSLFFIALLLVASFRYIDRKEIAKKEEAQIFLRELREQILGKIEKSDARTEQTDEEPIAPSLGEGFVQLEGRSIAIEKSEDAARVSQGDLRVGEIIKVKFTLANKGPRPVFDCQSWGLVVCVDPAKNPGKQLREVMLRGLKVGYEQFKKSGNDLGAGKEMFNFGQSTPLTEEELVGLKYGNLRAHVLLSGAWLDSKGTPFYWTNAEWTNWPQVPIEKSFWKGS